MLTTRIDRKVLVLSLYGETQTHTHIYKDPSIFINKNVWPDRVYANLYFPRGNNNSTRSDLNLNSLHPGLVDGTSQSERPIGGLEVGISSCGRLSGSTPEKPSAHH